MNGVLRRNTTAIAAQILLSFGGGERWSLSTVTKEPRSWVSLLGPPRSLSVASWIYKVSRVSRDSRFIGRMESLIDSLKLTLVSDVISFLDVLVTSSCSLGFNQIDLPQYSSYEMLRQQLLMAINEGGEGFGFAWTGIDETHFIIRKDCCVNRTSNPCNIYNRIFCNPYVFVLWSGDGVCFQPDLLTAPWWSLVNVFSINGFYHPSNCDNMRAFVIKQLAHPSQIPLSLDAPEPKSVAAGQVLIDVYSAGLNFFDVSALGSQSSQLCID